MVRVFIALVGLPAFVGLLWLINEYLRPTLPWVEPNWPFWAYGALFAGVAGLCLVFRR